MSSSKIRFDPQGEFSLSIARYLLQKAQEALGQGVSAKDADFAWETFRKECFTLAKSIADRHPGGKSDSFRLARVNFNKQASRFVQWLSSGRGRDSTCCIVFFLCFSHNYSGYNRAFAIKAGLIESGLGGSEGVVEGGFDPDYSGGEEEQENFDTPPDKSPVIKTPNRTRSFQLHDLKQNLEEIFREDEETMKIVTTVKEDVVVNDFSATKFHDLLIFKAALPPAAVLESVRIEIKWTIQTRRPCGT
jgi:hypothetical protein